MTSPDPKDGPSPLPMGGPPSPDPKGGGPPDPKGGGPPDPKGGGPSLKMQMEYLRYNFYKETFHRLELEWLIFAYNAI